MTQPMLGNADASRFEEASNQLRDHHSNHSAAEKAGDSCHASDTDVSRSQVLTIGPGRGHQ